MAGNAYEELGIVNRLHSVPKCNLETRGEGIEGANAMRLSYHPDTDSLYIDLSERPSTESHEIAEGVVLDYDEEGRLVGIDIDNARNKVDLAQLTLLRLPGEVITERV